MKKAFHPHALTAMTTLLAAALVALWLGCMYCLTSVTAEYAANRYLRNHSDRATQLVNYSLRHWLDRDYSEYENYRENRFWEAVSPKNFGNGNPVTGGSNGFLKRRSSDEIFAAAAVYDAEGNCLEGSWTDFFYFEYLTQEQWDANEERSGNNARAFFDRSRLTETGKEIVDDTSLTFDAKALRLTGSFDGVEFIPTRIDYIDFDEFQNALWSKGSGGYTVPGVVKAYDLQWITAYENPEALPAGAETVTFYSDWFDTCYTENSPAFSYQGENYQNAAALLQELGPTYAEGRTNLTRYEGLDLLILSVDYCYTYDGETYYDPYYYGTDGYKGEAPEVQFYIASAVYCSPWRTAFRELRNVYIGTFLLALALLLWLRSLARRHLTAPLQEYTEAMGKGWPHLHSDPYQRAALREIAWLQQEYQANRDTLHIRQNEINRLNTALDYARQAEENRRRLTSHVAHELKTPLAVVHSYAEGLREHIAEDKRERYTEVILSETERMDAMVLELLDLSRLEAGKVKLARDEVSLEDLTKTILERFEPQMAEKNLQVEFTVKGSTHITADEARLGQVITNFTANAVKYTPAGGSIRIRAERSGSKQWFLMENSSAPLADEVLESIWDSFYQADNARRDSGAGLGLAIARSIIDLHGGQRIARNTKDGVEFGFALPLS